jgi:CDP-6-deoxy-D-xylo-4-hexulose-3-dehydrase
MVSSGTAANFVLLAVAAGPLRGSRPRVGVAAVTWPTNVTPALFLGHEVTVFDINPRTLGIDVEQACAAMDRGELDILFVTHLLGFNALHPDLIASAGRNGVTLLEDCCEAHGTRFADRKVGSIGLASSFSFYFGHHMSTIEGGIVSTSDAGFADRIRLIRAHGLARESSRFDEYRTRYPDIDPQFLFVEAGLNFRPTEINAFLGLRQLDVLDERIEQRNRNLQIFLETVPGWLWRDYVITGASSFALPLVPFRAEDSGTIRAAVKQLGIESRPIVGGNLLRQPFLDAYKVTVDRGTTPTADHIHRSGLYVGNGHHVTEDMVRALTDTLRRSKRTG